MDFGRVPYNELDTMDFSLPKSNHSLSKETSATKSDFKFYFGTSRMGAPDWKGTIYPAGTK